MDVSPGGMSLESPSKGYQFIFRPTVACNLRCRYCYAAGLRDDGVGMSMTVSEARLAIDWMCRFCSAGGIERAAVLWHGGEPLLPGIDFLEQVLEYENSAFSKIGVAFSNQIQTNLTLVTDAHIDIFKRYFGGTIGFSWDFASAQRIFADGRNAAEEVWRKALMCRDRGVNVGAICQITNENRERPRDLYRWFADARIPFRLTPIFPSTLQETMQSADAACAVVDTWLSDRNPAIEIANFREMIEGLVTGRTHKCCAERNCGRVVLALSPQGRIYPCSRNHGGCDVVGNFLTDAPEDVYRRRYDFYADDFAPGCSSCEYVGVCQSGCPFLSRIGWHECECAYNRKIFDHLKMWLRRTGHVS